LRFADDIVLIGSNVEEIVAMAEELLVECARRSLEANMFKTKYMSNNRETELTILNTLIERVQEYLYLGRMISFSEGMDLELTNRRERAWKKFWSLKGIFKGQMSLEAKITV